MNITPILRLFAAALLLNILAVAVSDAIASEAYATMQEAYTRYKTSLSENAYGEPLHIISSFNGDLASGEIYALINHDFLSVSSHLITAEQWCDMLVLHVNVKGCYVMGQASSGKDNGSKSGAREIALFVGRSHYQPIDDAYVMNYKLSINKNANNHMKASLSAGSGPFGTSDYLLEFEVIPVGSNTSFIHFKYSYQYGFLAKAALGGYLATLGRNKVGFTVTEYDENNKPIYVKGMQGIVERNSMRYFIAIKAFLDTYSIATETWNQRIEHWYELAQPYKLQLIEIENRKYVETKQKEYENKVSLEDAMAIYSGNRNE